MARREYNGGSVATTLSGDITNASLSISVANGSTYPTGSTGPFVIDIDTGLSSYEKILVTSRSGNTFTVADTGDRGYDGTSAAAHVSNASIRHVSAAVDFDEANAHVNNAGTVLHTNAALAASGLDITKFTVGTSDRDTTGTAAGWTTGRTLTLTGDTTGVSSPFDGTGNISITTTVVSSSSPARSSIVGLSANMASTSGTPLLMDVTTALWAAEVGTWVKGTATSTRLDVPDAGLYLVSIEGVVGSSSSSGRYFLECIAYLNSSSTQVTLRGQKTSIEYNASNIHYPSTTFTAQIAAGGGFSFQMLQNTGVGQNDSIEINIARLSS